jgi:hypothetical protein
MSGAPHPENRIAGDEKVNGTTQFKKRGCSAEKRVRLPEHTRFLSHTFFYESHFFLFFQDFSVPVLPSGTIQYD